MKTYYKTGWKLVNRIICRFYGHVEGRTEDNGDASLNWRECLRCGAVGRQNLFISSEIKWRNNPTKEDIEKMQENLKGFNP